jgi:signal transduction histidine kinase
MVDGARRPDSQVRPAAAADRGHRPARSVRPGASSLLARVGAYFGHRVESAISNRALTQQVRWFMTMRFLAFVLIAATITFAKQALRIPLRYDLLYTAAVCVLAYNCLLFGWFERMRHRCRDEWCVRHARRTAHAQIVLDLASLAAMIHLSGGLESPPLFIFIFHPIFAAILLSRAHAYLYGLLALLVLGAVGVGEHAGALAHHHLEGFLAAEPFRSPTYTWGVLGVFAILQVLGIFITSSLASELRHNQVEVEVLGDDLLRKNAKLEKKDEMRLLLLANTTHDLKSPLNTIDSLIQSLLDGYLGELNAQQVERLGKVLARISGLRALISDILELSAIEVEEAPDKVVRIDLVKLATETVEDMRPSVEQSGLTIALEADLKEAPVRASLEHLGSVLHNYISNAVKYNRKGGSIRVRIGASDEIATCAVKDTGIGIEQEDLPRLFSDFFRTLEAKKSGQEGTGLGLGIVKRILERYGGTVGVESRFGEGSTFLLSLPLAPGRTADRAATTGRPASRPSEPPGRLA